MSTEFRRQLRIGRCTEDQLGVRYIFSLRAIEEIGLNIFAKDFSGRPDGAAQKREHVAGASADIGHRHAGFDVQRRDLFHGVLFSRVAVRIVK